MSIAKVNFVTSFKLLLLSWLSFWTLLRLLFWLLFWPVTIIIVVVVIVTVAAIGFAFTRLRSTQCFQHDNLKQEPLEMNLFWRLGVPRLGCWDSTSQGRAVTSRNPKWGDWSAPYQSGQHSSLMLSRSKRSRVFKGFAIKIKSQAREPTQFAGFNKIRRLAATTSEIAIALGNKRSANSERMIQNAFSFLMQ